MTSFFLTPHLQLDLDEDDDEDDDDDDNEFDEEDEDGSDEDDEDEEEEETWQVSARPWTGRSTPNRVYARANPLRDV